jgi:hypothetical protein
MKSLDIFGTREGVDFELQSLGRFNYWKKTIWEIERIKRAWPMPLCSLAHQLGPEATPA